MCTLLLAWSILVGCGGRHSGEAVRKIAFEVDGRPFTRSILGPDSNRNLRRQITQVETCITKVDALFYAIIGVTID